VPFPLVPSSRAGDVTKPTGTVPTSLLVHGWKRTRMLRIHRQKRILGAVALSRATLWSMSYDDTALTLQAMIADAADGLQLSEPVEALQRVAGNLAVAMHDLRWVAQADLLQQTPSDRGHALGVGIAGAHGAGGDYDGYGHDDSPNGHDNGHDNVGSGSSSPSQWTGMPLPSATEMQAAEADLRSHLPQIAEQLAEIEKAADAITADPKKGRVVERLSTAVKSNAVSKLSPFALLVVLWWLFVIAFPNDAAADVAVLALWYAVARDSWKKG
jgi:hypothetical protein